jgi:hypothetical protein
MRSAASFDARGALPEYQPDAPARKGVTPLGMETADQLFILAA